MPNAKKDATVVGPKSGLNQVLALQKASQGEHNESNDIIILNINTYMLLSPGFAS